jgi:hypothetical protein
LHKKKFLNKKFWNIFLMQTNREKRLAEMLAAPRCLVTNWKPTIKVSERKWSGGFGFVRINDQSVFVHASVVYSCGDEDAKDLTGKTLVVYDTEITEKGPSVTRAATLAEHEKCLAKLREEIKREEQARIESEQALLRKQKAEEAFRQEYPALLAAWRDELPAKVAALLSRELQPGLPMDLNPKWISRQDIPWDLEQEVRVILEPFEAQIRKWSLECLSRRWETIRQIGTEVAEKIGLSAAGFATWFKKESRDSNYFLLWRDPETVREEIEQVLVRYKRDLAWNSSLPVREKIIALAQSNANTHGTWSRADLSGTTMLTLTKDRPQIIAAYLGGARADVISGTYGNSGESWSYDSGRNVCYGEWEIRPDLAEMIREGRSGEALWRVRREIAVLEAPLRRAGRAADHAWVRWVLSHTPIGVTAEKLVTSEGLNYPRTSDVRGRAEALAIRVLEKYPKLHRAFRDAHTASIRKATEDARLSSVAQVRENWREMLSWGPRNLRDLHPDALALLEKIRIAQQRADQLAGPRKWEREREERERQEEIARQAKEKAAAEKAAEDAKFLTGNAWGALGDLKF